MKASKNDIAWYDEYYKIIQKNFTSWYAFMLPDIISKLKDGDKIFEIGCGQSKGLRYLVDNGHIKEELVYGIDQSNEAIDFSKNYLKKATLSVGDAYQIKYSDDYFDFILLMEVIEHIENPNLAIREILRVLKPGGTLYVSFPNYLNLPWLVIRLLARLFNKPNWIVLQPVDKIYNFFGLKRLFAKNGFLFSKVIGSNYFPPILYKYEKTAITEKINRLSLGFLSFHPVLIFRKKK